MCQNWFKMKKSAITNMFKWTKQELSLTKAELKKLENAIRLAIFKPMCERRNF